MTPSMAIMGGLGCTADVMGYSYIIRSDTWESGAISWRPANCGSFLICMGGQARKMRPTPYELIMAIAVKLLGAVRDLMN